MKYVKLPIPIDAWQINPEEKILPDWVQLAIDKGMFNITPYPNVSTLEGLMTGNLEDYLIKGVTGELYICSKRVFEKTYEPYVPESEKVLEVESIKDNPDGSANITLDMSYDNMVSFARIGIIKVLTDAANEALALKPMECGFADEEVMCSECNCWKSGDV